LNGPTRVRRVPVSDLSAADLESWRRLADTAVEPNPYFDPDFVLPCAEALRANPALLIAHDADGWAGCLPVHARRGWHRLPIRGLVSWRHLYCFLCAPLLRPDSAAPAAEALIRSAMDQAEGGFVGLDHLPGTGPVATAVHAAMDALGAKPVVVGRFRRAMLEQGEAGAEVSMSAKHRKELRRLKRRLGEALGGELSVADQAGDASAYEVFLEIERRGWKGRDGTAMESMGHGDLFREICERFAKRGALELVLLGTEERKVAGLCNLVAGDVGFSFKIGSDEEYSRFSPGIQMEAEYARIFGERRRLRLMDSCAEPGQAMINRLWPGRRELEILAIPAPGLRGASAAPLLRGLGWARRRRAG
jgi:CelD/BcsL family acetyltransferase involved in cellulose biosynthesis